MEHPATETLARALAALDADACVRIVEEVGRAVGPARLLNEIYLPALARVGDIWARGLLDDLAFAQAAVICEQLWGLVAGAAAPKGTAAAEPGPAVVIGVIAPDVHDVGKNQVVIALGRAGARVHDLGTQVEPEAFARKAGEVGAAAVMAAASTQAALARVGEVRDALDAAGVSARLIVGGQAAMTGGRIEVADAIAVDAYQAVDEVVLVAGRTG